MLMVSYQLIRLPPGVDISLFDTNTGLGTITASISGAGRHTFDAFFDHDIGARNFSNEVGKARRTLASGQSWEIDEPIFQILSVIS